MTSENIFLGSTETGENEHLAANMINRHGLILGATGTGKTITLQVLAEQLLNIGVPVFMTDIKGDLSGIAAAGKTNKEIARRMNIFKLEDKPEFYKGQATVFWDVYGKTGVPLTTTVAEMGPEILARLFDSNDIQTDTLRIVFNVAKTKKWPLVTLENLKFVLNEIRENRKVFEKDYGNISASTLGAIQRDIMSFIADGLDEIFGEPTLQLKDLIAKKDGNAIAHILDATELAQNPTHYASVLLALLSKIYDGFEEAGDLDKPKLAVFFDEAHMIFKDAPKDLVEKVEKVIRLIRSKGVSIFFITQSPQDIPENISAQIGNRVIHGLRGFNKKERQSIKNIAASIARKSEEEDRITDLIPALGIGESVVSILSSEGLPKPAKKIINMCPGSKIGPIDQSEKTKINTSWDKCKFYETRITKEVPKPQKTAEEEVSAEKSPVSKSKAKVSSRQTPSEAFFKSMLRKLATLLVSLVGVFARSYIRKSSKKSRRRS